MRIHPQQASVRFLFRGIWMLVALAIALGGLKNPRILEITHSHQDGARVHANVLELLEAGEHRGQGHGNQDKHTHRIPVGAEVAATAARHDTKPFLRPLSAILPAEWHDLSGPSRPSDRLIRPPKFSC